LKVILENSGIIHSGINPTASYLEFFAYSSITTMDRLGSAPAFEVADRNIIAVEHPAVFKNSLDNGLKTFGIGSDTTGQPFKRVSESRGTSSFFRVLLSTILTDFKKHIFFALFVSTEANINSDHRFRRY
jgi:hypothetical protein